MERESSSLLDGRVGMGYLRDSLRMLICVFLIHLSRCQARYNRNQSSRECFVFLDLLALDCLGQSLGDTSGRSLDRCASGVLLVAIVGLAGRGWFWSNWKLPGLGRDVVGIMHLSGLVVFRTCVGVLASVDRMLGTIHVLLGIVLLVRPAVGRRRWRRV